MSEEEQAWNAFVDAARKAQATMKIEDGLAARRAWQAFMQIETPAPSLTVEAAE